MSEFTWENLENTELYKSVVNEAEGLLDAASDVRQALSDMGDAIYSKDAQELAAAMEALTDAQGSFSQQRLVTDADSLCCVALDEMQGDEE